MLSSVRVRTSHVLSGSSESEARVPLIRELDPSAGPLDFFGAELRRWRTTAGLSQEQLGQRVGYSGAQVGKVETGERAPSQDFAQRCDQALPDAGGLFVRILPLPAAGTAAIPPGSLSGSALNAAQRRCAGGNRCSFPASSRQPTTRGPCSRHGARQAATTSWISSSARGWSGSRSSSCPGLRRYGSSWTKGCSIAVSAAGRSCRTSLRTWRACQVGLTSPFRSCPQR
jgi:DNA-binding XRE family transcriptional regulator